MTRLAGRFSRIVELVEEIDASRLVIEDLVADVEVRTTRDGPMTITVRGPGQDVGAVGVSGDGWVRGDGSQTRSLSVVAEVPPGCPLRIIGRIGYAVIGDIDAPLWVDITGPGRLRTGRVTDTRIGIAGDARADIASIAGGSFDTRVCGGGRIVARGDVDDISALVVGSGNIYFGGSARQADLVVRGDGHITVSNVTGQLERSISGSGDIAVAHLPLARAQRIPSLRARSTA